MARLLILSTVFIFFQQVNASLVLSNYFQCSGKDLSIEYHEATDGEHIFDFTLKGKPTQVRGKDRIRKNDLELGRLITIDTQYAPDLYREMESILLPIIYMDAKNTSIDFETFLISTTALVTVNKVPSRPYTKIAITKLKCFATWK